DGDGLNFARNVPTANRSISFGMTEDQSFALEGIIAEWDGGDRYSHVYLGGIDGVWVTSSVRPTLSRAIFTGAELQSSDTPFIDVTMKFLDIQTFIEPGAGGYIQGEITFTIFVS